MSCVPTPPTSQAAARFLASMNITYEMWHDGVGYDLQALAQVPGDELAAIEARLIQHAPRDWRDIEALGCIDSPAARAAVQQGLSSRDAAVRRVARRYAPGQEDDAVRTRQLVQSLEEDEFITNGLAHSIDEAAEFHPPAVIDALFRGTLNRQSAAVHFAALLMYLHGKAPTPFDWAQRPFFLRFNTPQRSQKEEAFRELCGKVGVDPAKYLK